MCCDVMRFSVLEEGRRRRRQRNRDQPMEQQKNIDGENRLDYGQTRLEFDATRFGFGQNPLYLGQSCLHFSVPHAVCCPPAPLILTSTRYVRPLYWRDSRPLNNRRGTHSLC